MKTTLFLFILLASPSLLRALPLELGASQNNNLSGHIKHWRGRIYVSGTVKSILPGLRAPGSYVEVDLFAADGRILESAQDRIGRATRHPRLNPSGRTRYVVSFPETIAAQAASARVLFHNHSPETCPRQS